jgi:hypothetical protein
VVVVLVVLVEDVVVELVVVVDVVVVIVGVASKSIDISNKQHSLSGNSTSRNLINNSHKGSPFLISEHS